MKKAVSHRDTAFFMMILLGSMKVNVHCIFH